jgi:ribonuclease J
MSWNHRHVLETRRHDSSATGFSDDRKVLDAPLLPVADQLSHTEAEGITDTYRIAQVVRRLMGSRVGEIYRGGR